MSVEVQIQQKGRSWLPICIVGGLLIILGSGPIHGSVLPLLLIGHGTGLMLYAFVVALNNVCNRGVDYREFPVRDRMPVVRGTRVGDGLVRR